MNCVILDFVVSTGILSAPQRVAKVWGADMADKGFVGLNLTATTDSAHKEQIQVEGLDKNLGLGMDHATPTASVRRHERSRERVTPESV